ncbi:MAG: pro-sigmaK processing inhibitor BofA family protein [Bacilli bacterium]|nr:pro-sigmaK processing inhibitor BofA family protein [Bacilli bacterium]
MKKIIKCVRKTIMSFLILYGYNILVPARAIIPINIITVFLITLFNIAGLILLITIKLLIY